MLLCVCASTLLLKAVLLNAVWQRLGLTGRGVCIVGRLFLATLPQNAAVLRVGMFLALVDFQGGLCLRCALSAACASMCPCSMLTRCCMPAVHKVHYVSHLNMLLFSGWLCNVSRLYRSLGL